MLKTIFFVIAFSVSFAVQAAYNFGVVVNNEHYKIYRSAILGSKGLLSIQSQLKKKGLPFPKTIIYMNDYGYGRNGLAIQERNLQGKYGFKFIHPHGEWNSYLDGHDPRYPRKDVDGDGLRDGDVEIFYRILETVLDKENQPVLFHCRGGMHRTGMIGMAIRYIQSGEWVDGYKYRRFVFPRIRTPWLNKAENEYVNYNAILFRFTNVRFIRAISQEPRFIEIGKTYQDELH